MQRVWYHHKQTSEISMLIRLCMGVCGAPGDEETEKGKSETKTATKITVQKAACK